MTDRFLFKPVGPGAVLLDNQSGAILELNESAAFIWRRKLNDESPGEIADALAIRYHLSRDTALSELAYAALPESNTSVPIPSDASYTRSPEGYTFAFRGAPLFAVHEGGQVVRTIGEPSETGQTAEMLLHALVPKLLGLRGETVLHASAVDVGGAVIAFSGISGAGKTTTARTAVRAGARPVSEDQLIVETTDSAPRVWTDAEPAISGWVLENARRVTPGAIIECGELDNFRQGTALPLKQIGFLAIARRSGHNYDWSSLQPWQAAAQIARNIFYGSDDRSHWDAQLEAAAKVATSTECLELRVPEGLDLLGGLARSVLAAGTLKL